MKGTKMRRITLSIVVLALIMGFCGCSRQYARTYEYRYRAGTEYEYKELMQSWDPDGSKPAPLPPLSEEPGEGAWVRVPIQGPAYGYDGYGPTREVIIVDDPWCYPSYYSTSFRYSPRRHHRSGLSIGFGFGTHYPADHFRRHPFGWHDPFYCWP